MRLYDIVMLVTPDLSEEETQKVAGEFRKILADGGAEIVKEEPWGRRRLAYPIGQHREGSYHILLFDAPPPAVLELERGLNISEEVMRHLVTRVEKPLSRRPNAQAGDDMELDEDTIAGPPPELDEEEIPDEFIDESESEAAPAAIDR